MVFGFFALLVIAVMPAYRRGPVEVTIRNEPERQRDISSPLRPTFASVPAAPPPVARVEKKCPDCAEMVLVEARLCRHCGYRFDGKGDVKAIDHQPSAIAPSVPSATLYFDGDQQAGASVLRALAEAAAPMHPGQTARIVDVVLNLRGWSKLSHTEIEDVTRWINSPDNDKSGLRTALEQVARWPRQRAEMLVAVADEVVRLGNGPGTTDGRRSS